MQAMIIGRPAYIYEQAPGVFTLYERSVLEKS
jgi:hypothetical protein